MVHFFALINWTANQPETHNLFHTLCCLFQSLHAGLSPVFHNSWKITLFIVLCLIMDISISPHAAPHTRLFWCMVRMDVYSVLGALAGSPNMESMDWRI
mmetsp:Transcript_7051/g.26435  ORF Transcript_7051/g.26435 Transcript_7051/m.26435 type:complete len:99 (-) Transcript_7051:875-1171(-)